MNHFRDNAKVREVLRNLEKRTNFLQNYGEVRTAKILENALLNGVENNNYDYIRAIDLVSSTGGMIPVSIDQFIEDPEYLGDKFEVWPKLRETLRNMKPDLMTGSQPITTILNSSSIGTGKSVLGQISMLYDLYVLCCFKKPHRLFNKSIDDSTPILFVMQSVRDHISRRVLYEPFRSIFETIPFFKKYTNWNKDKESELILDNKIQVVPMVASPLHYIGQAVISAIIDEANFMEVVIDSRKSGSGGQYGKGGMFDQAQLVYSNIQRRRKSRFLTKGVNPGSIYTSSSVNYVNDFMDRQVQDYDPTRDTHIMCIDFRQWDVKPYDFDTGNFKFLVGTNDYPSKILPDTPKESVDYPRGAKIEEVPNEFREDFRRDPDNSQRDILNVRSMAIHRFISQTHKIIEACKMARDNNIYSFLLKDNVTLAEDGLPIIVESKLPTDRSGEYFVHIDLSRSSDKCGIAMSKVKGYMACTTQDGVVENLPVFAVILACTIQPDNINQIDIADIRQWVILLKTYYGFNIVQVTYDGFDSQESIQMWRKMGVSSFKISMDLTIEPYSYIRTGFYQDRVLLVENTLINTEFATLERHERGGKAYVNHNIASSKDGSDAVTGSVYGASIYRKTRVYMGTSDDKGNVATPERRRADRRPATRR